MLTVMLLLPNATPTQGAGNHLDYGFSGNGMVTTNYIGNSNDEAQALAIQLDGKIVVAGKTNVGSSDPEVDNFAVMRYAADGSLDLTFGANGKVNTDFEGRDDESTAVAIQTNGRIVVVGKAKLTNGNDFAIARYTASGSLDTTFGGNGKVTVDMGGDDQARAVALQPDGKIVVSGSVQPTGSASEFALLRLNSTGTLDTTFDGNGKLITNFGGTSAAANDVIVQTDGKITACGYATAATRMFAVARYNSNGSLDGTFDSDGRVTISTGGAGSAALTIRQLANNHYLLAGKTYGSPVPPDYYIVRIGLFSNGSQDGIYTSVHYLPDLIDTISGMVVDSGGNLSVVGYSSYYNPNNFIVSQTKADGHGDPRFGYGGYVFTHFGLNQSQSRAVAVQKNGMLVVAGSSLNADGTNDFAVARYRPRSIAAHDDYDGEGLADFTVFRRSNSFWYVLNNAQTNVTSVFWGTNGDIPVPGDYDRDGISDPAVFRPSMGTWYVLRSSTQTTLTVPLGSSTDKPVQADYDGDGFTDQAVFSPSTGNWTILRSQLGQTTVNFGVSTDKPVPADYDGDGLDDVAVFTPSTGTWNLKRSRLGPTSVQFGANFDVPVPGDYDGDGSADLAVYRPSNHYWYIFYSLYNQVGSLPFGNGTTLPAPADFDGDGKFDWVVFDQVNGMWSGLNTSSGNPSATFGQAGDVPIPYAYVPR
ncbi:MAG: FG-GAP-like repeat-containing protein [Pyrinomonadaceae bacterium]